jgi:hypothetical protein
MTTTTSYTTLPVLDLGRLEAGAQERAAFLAKLLCLLECSGAIGRTRGTA